MSNPLTKSGPGQSRATNTLRVAALAFSLAAAGTLQGAFAQDKPAAPTTAKTAEHCAHMGGHRDHAAHLQKKLDDLGTKLHLKDNQQAAWKDYRAEVTELAAARQKQMEGKKSHAESGKNLTAPEQLQKAADRMRAGADQLDKLAKQTANFYKTLTPEQQTIFDLYQKDLRQHHGSKHRMH